MPSKKHKPLLLVNVVGLSESLLGDATPNINALKNSGSWTYLKDTFPAVTTTAQACMLTGTHPNEHGIVGNGWYWRDQAEVKFWQQSNHLVNGEKVWEKIKKHNPDFVCSKLFWWYNMYASADYSITPRPHYPADGRKIMGLYSHPAHLQAEIEQDIGEFPFFNFWGPLADIRSSRWIVDCALKEWQMHKPDLQLIYLPHLDYNLQRLGPNAPEVQNDLAEIDTEVGRLVNHAKTIDAEIVLVSEYGISQVDQSIALNQLFRKEGLLKVRESVSWELLDAGASEAFAVADHQVAHIYVKNPKNIDRVKAMVEAVDGVEQVLDEATQAEHRINHARSGDLIAIAKENAWFNYYYWLDDAKAPDFARTVDIHRKPGYDPVELFVDPKLKIPKLRVIRRLIQKKLGMRMLMDVIPLDPSLVKGSHGRPASTPAHGPLLISSFNQSLKSQEPMTFVHDMVLKHFAQ